jgi:p-aminobenzoyl-glutamate transporter AbgT
LKSVHLVPKKAISPEKRKRRRKKREVKRKLRKFHCLLRRFRFRLSISSTLARSLAKQTFPFSTVIEKNCQFFSVKKLLCSSKFIMKKDNFVKVFFSFFSLLFIFLALFAKSFFNNSGIILKSLKNYCKVWKLSSFFSASFCINFNSILLQSEKSERIEN